MITLNVEGSENWIEKAADFLVRLDQKSQSNSMLTVGDKL